MEPGMMPSSPARALTAPLRVTQTRAPRYSCAVVRVDIYSAFWGGSMRARLFGVSFRVGPAAGLFEPPLDRVPHRSI